MLTKVSTWFEIQTIMFIVCNRDEDKKEEQADKLFAKDAYVKSRQTHKPWKSERF